MEPKNDTATSQEYEPEAGEHIGKTAEALTEMAKSGRPAHASFNGVYLVATEISTKESVLAQYETEMDRLRAESEAKRLAHEATPEGQEELRQRAEKEVLARAEVDKGVLPFDAKYPEGWAKTVSANDDPYGACGVRFAARWANYMEREMANGATVGAVAKATSSEADIEGITGFMYGCAVGILSKVWRHGEELRRWHNLDTQLGHEGEKANESGGVLNPALMTIGGAS